MTKPKKLYEYHYKDIICEIAFLENHYSFDGT